MTVNLSKRYGATCYVILLGIEKQTAERYNKNSFITTVMASTLQRVAYTAN